MLYSRFLRVEMFIKHPCPDFQGEIFHKSSIALSAYYMYANTIIVFNNYTVCLQVWRSLSKQSPLYQDTTFVKPDAWSAAVRTTLPCQQERFLLCKDNLAKSRKNVEQYTRLLVLHSYSTVHLATLAFSLAEIFSYMPIQHHCPFVHNGFYHWLYIIINSINL